MTRHRWVAVMIVGAAVAAVVTGIRSYYWGMAGSGGASAPRFVDACWFSVQTITTTGFGSFPAWTDRLKWASIALMLFAAPMWGVMIGLFANMIQKADRDGS